MNVSVKVNTAMLIEAIRRAVTANADRAAAEAILGDTKRTKNNAEQ